MVIALPFNRGPAPLPDPPEVFERESEQEVDRLLAQDPAKAWRDHIIYTSNRASAHRCKILRKFINLPAPIGDEALKSLSIDLMILSQCQPHHVNTEMVKERIACCDKMLERNPNDARVYFQRSAALLNLLIGEWLGINRSDWFAARFSKTFVPIGPIPAGATMNYLKFQKVMIDKGVGIGSEEAIIVQMLLEHWQSVPAEAKQFILGHLMDAYKAEVTKIESEESTDSDIHAAWRLAARIAATDGPF